MNALPSLRRNFVFLLTFSTMGCLTSSVMAQNEPSPVVRQAPLVFVATLSKAQAGPVGLSFPPLRTFELGFEKADQPLRGTLPKSLEFSYSIRTAYSQPFTIGERYLVAARLSQGQQVLELLQAKEVVLEATRNELKLPIGWLVKSWRHQTFISPWLLAKPERPWPKDNILKGDFKCFTGRPTLLAGEGITIEVEQVLPANINEFQNPYGDGQFKVTITNTNKTARTVPALLKDGDEIRWEDSLVIVCSEQAYVLPSHKPLKNPSSVELGPGESIATVVDTLLLDDAPWPRGGSRITFTFALGEVATDNFFYYFSGLHDMLRAKRKQAAK